MPLETILPDGLPADLNTDWPLTVDQIFEGSAHLRNVKLAVQNHWTAYLADKVFVQSFYVDGNPGHATNTLLVDGFDKNHYLDADNLTGEILHVNADTATTVAPGLAWLSSTVGTDETRAATPRMLNDLKKAIDDKDVNSDLVKWKAITPSGTGTQLLPAEIRTELMALRSVELNFVLDTAGILGTYNVMLFGEDISVKLTYRDGVAVEKPAVWSVELLDSADGCKIVTAGTPLPTVVKAAWRKVKVGV